jgi:hypothetical protein
MFRKIRSLWVKILPRWAPAKEVRGKETEAATLVHRRVEVTVERESVWILAPGQSADAAEGTAGGKDGLEATCKELQAPAQPPALPAEAPAPEGRGPSPGASEK